MQVATLYWMLTVFLERHSFKGDASHLCPRHAYPFRPPRHFAKTSVHSVALPVLSFFRTPSQQHQTATLSEALLRIMRLRASLSKHNHSQKHSRRASTMREEVICPKDV
jgi:hypothetical protein